MQDGSLRLRGDGLHVHRHLAVSKRLMSEYRKSKCVFGPKKYSAVHEKYCFKRERGAVCRLSAGELAGSPRSRGREAACGRRRRRLRASRAAGKAPPEIEQNFDYRSRSTLRTGVSQNFEDLFEARMNNLIKTEKIDFAEYNTKY